jgi:hypothetical protein
MTATTTGAFRSHHRSRSEYTTRVVPRTRGMFSGFTIFVLGLWAAFIPFVGPYFDYSYGSDRTWDWTAARGWLEVLPGAVAAAGGLLLLTSANRINASTGGWIAAAGGAWLVVGRSFADLFNIGSVGAPLSTSDSGRMIAELGYFVGTGTVIVFLAAVGIGRLAVVGVRDVRPVEETGHVRTATAPTTADNAARVEDNEPTTASATPYPERTTYPAT